MSPSGVSQLPSSETRSVNPVEPSWSKSVGQDEAALAINAPDNTLLVQKTVMGHLF